MELVAYAGPETGTRDHKAYVLKAGTCRFVITGGVHPDSPLLDHHRAHGDGVSDIALEVPDVDRTPGGDRRVRRHPALAGRPLGLCRPVPARLCWPQFDLHHTRPCAEAAVPGP